MPVANAERQVIFVYEVLKHKRRVEILILEETIFLPPKSERNRHRRLSSKILQHSMENVFPTSLRSTHLLGATPFRLSVGFEKQ